LCQAIYCEAGAGRVTLYSTVVTVRATLFNLLKPTGCLHQQA